MNPEATTALVTTYPSAFNPYGPTSASVQVKQVAALMPILWRGVHVASGLSVMATVVADSRVAFMMDTVTAVNVYGSLLLRCPEVVRPESPATEAAALEAAFTRKKTPTIQRLAAALSALELRLRAALQSLGSQKCPYATSYRMKANQILSDFAYYKQFLPAEDFQNMGSTYSRFSNKLSMVRSHVVAPFASPLANHALTLPSAGAEFSTTRCSHCADHRWHQRRPRQLHRRRYCSRR
jgi:hypothetical protein